MGTSEFFATSTLVKKSQATVVPTEKWRKSAVHTVNEHFEPLLNAVMCREGLFNSLLEGQALTGNITLAVASIPVCEVGVILHQTKFNFAKACEL